MFVGSRRALLRYAAALSLPRGNLCCCCCCFRGAAAARVLAASAEAACCCCSRHSSRHVCSIPHHANAISCVMLNLNEVQNAGTSLGKAVQLCETAARARVRAGGEVGASRDMLSAEASARSNYARVHYQRPLNTRPPCSPPPCSPPPCSPPPCSPPPCSPPPFCACCTC